MYRNAFRECFVSVRLLLLLTDDELHAMGVKNALHRKAILFDIADLKSAVVSDSSSSLDHVDAKAEYDIFLSYRRKGGQDFAHLLKLSFSNLGYNVFLDIDNLGSGNFDAKLRKSLEASKNVILVWTNGCMDRFLDDADSNNEDFVRKEYLLALSLKKNIVPVTKEDFVFPLRNRLPLDTQKIIEYNAVPY